MLDLHRHSRKLHISPSGSSYNWVNSRICEYLLCEVTGLHVGGSSCLLTVATQAGVWTSLRFVISQLHT